MHELTFPMDRTKAIAAFSFVPLKGWAEFALYTYYLTDPVDIFIHSFSLFLPYPIYILQEYSIILIYAALNEITNYKLCQIVLDYLLNLNYWRKYIFLRFVWETWF